MSVTAVTSLFQQGLSQSQFQQIKSQIQQVGRDLQAGNLTLAQQDFATFTQNLPAPAAQPQSATGTLAQAVSTLAQDLKAGNLAAAQKDFTTIQQDRQQPGQVHHHHNHRVGDAQESNSASGQPNNPLSQDLGALKQALQSGNLSSAQQAYATLQQDLVQLLPAVGAASSGTAGTPSSTGSTVSVTA